MPKTDTREQGLEAVIVRDMLERGWIQGQAQDDHRENALDLVQLRAFLEAAQPQALAHFSLNPYEPSGRQFLARLQGEITKRGVVDVLFQGIRERTLGHKAESDEES